MYIQFDISDFSVTISSFFLIPFYYLVIWFLASSSPLLSKSNKKTHRFIDVFLKRIFKSYECSAFKLIKRCKKGVFSHKVHLIIPWILTLPYHFGILPWQMNKILIINFSCSKMPCVAEFCKVSSAFSSIVFFLFITTLFAKHFKMVQFKAMCSSQIVVS